MEQVLVLRKLKHNQAPNLCYHLGSITLNDLLGESVSLGFTGRIECIGCGREIKKTFNQGFCFPCFRSLACCDTCIVKPELCHYHAGTCREPEWGEANCLIEHVVYLANSTGLKVGVTGAHKLHERWGDQGAIAALVLARTTERREAGLLEAELRRRSVPDRTDWRALITGKQVEVDLRAVAKQMISMVSDQDRELISATIDSEDVYEFRYPVQRYLKKPLLHRLESDGPLVGRLEGIRGQYLIIGEKAVNIRKYQGYEVRFCCA